MPKGSGVVEQLPSHERVLQALDAILASEPFRNAGRLSRFLRYAVEQSLQGNTAGLKEYRIGLDVFGRKTNYDTRIDPVVRVEARQLRFKLADYYARFGQSDEVIISLPKGGYAAHFEWRNQDTAQETKEFLPPASPPKPVRTRPRNLAQLAGILVLALLIAGAGLSWYSRSHPPRVRPVTPEVRDLSLRGRYYWSKRTPEALNQALDLFTQAVTKDRAYAPAYVGLADTYNLLSEYTPMRYSEAFPRAVTAARKAVALDDRSPEAHTSLAFALFWGAWDSTSAEREYKRAIELNPNYVMAHHWYATMLSGSGRSAEAIREIETARELDPTSTSILADKGMVLLTAGKRDEARTLLERLQESDPSFVSSHRYLATLYLTEGRFADYLRELKSCAQLMHDREQLDLLAAGEQALNGGGPRAMLEAIQSAKPPQRPRNYQFAAICTALNDRSKAFQYLHAAIEARESDVVVLSSAPEFSALHNDPRWQDVLKQVRASAHSHPI